MQDSNWYGKLVFPRHLILNMLRIRHYEKNFAMYSYIWDSLTQLRDLNVKKSLMILLFYDRTSIQTSKQILLLYKYRHLKKRRGGVQFLALKWRNAPWISVIITGEYAWCNEEDGRWFWWEDRRDDWWYINKWNVWKQYFVNVNTF